jgi:hypothetical protein
MIPTIPLWFRPWMLKAGVGVLFILAIFYSGCRTQKNIDANKIAKMKTKVETVKHNNELSLAAAAQSLKNYQVLEQAVLDNNAKVIRLGEENNLRVIAIRHASQTAIDNINTTHNAAMHDAIKEINRLTDRFSVLSVSEACHESWMEVVK